jgi:hypothetical protein
MQSITTSAVIMQLVTTTVVIMQSITALCARVAEPRCGER